MKNRKKKLINNYDFSSLINKFKAEIKDIVSQMGLDLYNLSFIRENNINYLRVTICHTDRNTSLSDCELVSRTIEKFLDTKELIPFSYTLEVQSKGALSGLGLVIKS